MGGVRFRVLGSFMFWMTLFVLFLFEFLIWRFYLVWFRSGFFVCLGLLGWLVDLFVRLFVGGQWVDKGNFVIALILVLCLLQREVQKHAFETTSELSENCQIHKARGLSRGCLALGPCVVPLNRGKLAGVTSKSPWEVFGATRAGRLRALPCGDQSADACLGTGLRSSWLGA